MNRFFFRTILLFFFCLFFQHGVYATHIVGGEITARWTGVGSLYQITLYKYDNQISGYYNTNAVSTTEYVNVNGNSITLKLVSNTIINTNANLCTTPTLYQTYFQVYSEIVDLDLYPGNEYVFEWGGCCRNSILTNIIKIGSVQEQEIYLSSHFKNLLNNSTPTFRPLGNEFFCRGVLNVFDLSATDIDGDSLVYKLDVPKTARNSEVIWASPSTDLVPIPGNVPLTINSKTGQASFNPSQLGIFLFGIKVQEYRNGILIGEVRKEYQFSVQDCLPNNKPEIGFQNRAIKNYDTLTVQLKENKCFPVYITDIDASNLFMNQTIKINQSINNTFPAAAITIPTQVNLTGFRPTAYFNMCLKPCIGGLRLNETTYYPHEIIITDDRCPVQYDTLFFTIKVEVNPNITPQVFIDPATTSKTVKVNNTLSFNVYGTDADVTDTLSLTMYDGQRAMNFQNVTDSISNISSRFSWTPNCNDLNPGVYNVYFILKDNSCSLNSSDTVYQQIIIEDNEADFSGIEVTNLITPNGDGLNDFYHVPGIPVGNCEKYFKGIEIYNRWGARVFYSDDRLFKWDPKDSDGIYYFSIDLNYKIIKGWIEIIR